MKCLIIIVTEKDLPGRNTEEYVPTPITIRKVIIEADNNEFSLFIIDIAIRGFLINRRKGCLNIDFIYTTPN